MNSELMLAALCDFAGMLLHSYNNSRIRVLIEPRVPVDEVYI